MQIDLRDRVLQPGERVGITAEVAVEHFARGYLPKRTPTLHRFSGVAGLEWDVDGDGLVDCWVLAGSVPHLDTMQ